MNEDRLDALHYLTSGESSQITLNNHNDSEGLFEAGDSISISNGNTNEPNLTGIVLGTSGSTINIQPDLRINDNEYYITQQPVQQPFEQPVSPFRGVDWQGRQLNEADVIRLIKEYHNQLIKDKKAEDKTPEDLLLLMKEYKFPKKMVDIVIKALGQEWPVEKDPTDRMEDLIHE